MDFAVINACVDKTLTKPSSFGRISGGFVLLLLILMLCASCDDSKGKKTVSTSRTAGSAPYELLVVTNKDWLKSDAGEPLRNIIESQVPGLPQVEQNFRVTTINPEGFNNTFKVYGNILFVTIDKKYEKAEIGISYDVYVHPQIVMQVHAPDSESFAQLVESNGEDIIQKFIDAELARERQFLSRKYSGTVMKQATKQFGYTINAPEEITSIKVEKDFFWSSSNDNTLNVCMYTYPYQSEQDLTIDGFLKHRDAFMRQYIQGERKDQYMTTQEKLITSRDIVVDGQTIQEVRGLWEMENDAMGGAFVSYSRLDSVSNTVVVAEGFVYAPEKHKRELIRELEASLQTMKKINK